MKLSPYDTRAGEDKDERRADICGHANEVQIWAGFESSRTPRPSDLEWVHALSRRVDAGWIVALEMTLR
jgi:hypothetical protein